jgi:hypothetical protein
MMPRLAASGRLNNLNIFTYLHMSPGLTGTPVLNTTSKEQMPSRENFRGTGELSGRMESVADDMLLGYGHNRSLLANEDMYMRYVYIYIYVYIIRICIISNHSMGNTIVIYIYIYRATINWNLIGWLLQILYGTVDLESQPHSLPCGWYTGTASLRRAYFACNTALNLQLPQRFMWAWMVIFYKCSSGSSM